MGKPISTREAAGIYAAPQRAEPVVMKDGKQGVIMTCTAFIVPSKAFEVTVLFEDRGALQRVVVRRSPREKGMAGTQGGASYQWLEVDV